MKYRIKRWLRKFPQAKRLLKPVWDAADRAAHRRDIEVYSKFPLFAPNSSGSYAARAELTILAVNQTFPFMTHFLEAIGQNQLIASMETAEKFCLSGGSTVAATQLKQILDKYGSDKGGYHDYHYVYGQILRNSASVSAVLEVGLGTNNEDVISNMGDAGKPGASLRAFRDFLPNAKVYGADVDKRVLFSDDRIRTFFVDQTDLSTFDALGKNVGTDFDLIIDDGLHSPNANIAVLAFAFNKLKRGGWFVVEDIPESALPVWQVVAALLPTGYEPHLISAKGGFLFLIQRS